MTVSSCDQTTSQFSSLPDYFGNVSLLLVWLNLHKALHNLGWERAFSLISRHCSMLAYFTTSSCPSPSPPPSLQGPDFSPSRLERSGFPFVPGRVGEEERGAFSGWAVKGKGGLACVFLAQPGRPGESRRRGTVRCVGLRVAPFPPPETCLCLRRPLRGVSD